MIPIRDSTPSRRAPVVNYILIAINFIVFLFEISLGGGLDNFIGQWAMIPQLVATDPTGLRTPGPPPLLTIVTSMFMHGGWMHLLGNMLFLWIFGDNVEDAMGSLRYLVFYLLAGIVASLAQLVMSLDSPLPSLGASGAISGVLGAYLVLYPGARVLTWIPVLIFVVIRIPAVIFIGLWFVLQTLQGLASVGDTSSGGVAWFAHIGGFVAGVVLVFFFRQREHYRMASY